jgi:ABC-type polysaccharide/polyol phosphate transport system ATPase subunit
VGFDLRKGEILGLIGPNGSGKTTLLRVITGVFPPDEGSVCIRGRIGALLALGAGFHPHMTGMENIYLNGTILGMRREEIDEKIQSIVEFSEIRAFMDAPVSTYSSGMTVRLGFAIAVHMDPEILIIDEVLAVGDMSFQRKSLKRILELCHDGRAVVFVSHNMRSVQDLCTSTVFLKDGRIQASGRTRDVVREYIDASRKRLDPTRVAGTSGLAEENPDTGGVRVKRVQIVGEDGAPLGRLNMRQRFVVEITYERRDPEVKADFQVTLFTEDGTTVRCFNTKFNGVQVALYDEGVVQFIMEELPLMPGRFVLRGSVLDSTTGVPHDVWGVVDDRFVEFEVLADELSQGGMVAWDNLGIVSLPHVWSTRPTS